MLKHFVPIPKWENKRKLLRQINYQLFIINDLFLISKRIIQIELGLHHKWTIGQILTIVTYASSPTHSALQTKYKKQDAS